MQIVTKWMWHCSGALDSTEYMLAWWSFCYHACLMGSYYILQPFRDEMGLQYGLEYIPSLFIIALGLIALMNPLFSYCVSKYPSSVFIPFTNRVLVTNLIIFWCIFQLDLNYWEEVWKSPRLAPNGPGRWRRYLSCAFFLWVSVYSLFSVSVFWGFVTNIISNDRGKRLFGFIGAGGTIGQLVGSAVTSLLASWRNPTDVLLCSALVLELTLYCVRKLIALRIQDMSPTNSPILPRRLNNDNITAPCEADDETTQNRPLDTKIKSVLSESIEGIKLVLQSRHLLCICGYLFLYSFTSSCLYFQKVDIVHTSLTSSATRTSFFANVNIAIGLGTLFVQLFWTRRLLATFGVTAALELVPVCTLVGFSLLSFQHTLLMFAGVETIRKTLNYAMSRPARELLYTVLSRSEKYKAKLFIDTFVCRSGDAVAAAMFAWLAVDSSRKDTHQWYAFLASILWIVLAWYLGWVHIQKVAQLEIKFEQLS